MPIQIDPQTGERIQPQGAIQIDPVTGERITAPAAPPPEQHPAMNFLKDIVKGVGESGVSLMSTGDEFARQHLPAFLTNTNFGFGKPADLGRLRDLATPADTTQAVSKGVGNAAQFMIPGSLEERVAAGAPGMLSPLLKLGSAALASGAVIATSRRRRA